MNTSNIDVSIVDPAALDAAAVVSLYDAVGWSAYTRDAPGLLRALKGSYRVAAAFGGDGRLMGLARILSDGETITYLQDVLVHPDFQRTGTGRRLVATLFESVPMARQRVLITDDEQRQRAFYESLGLTEAHDHNPPIRAFIAFSN